MTRSFKMRLWIVAALAFATALAAGSTAAQAQTAAPPKAKTNAGIEANQLARCPPPPCSGPLMTANAR